MYEGQPPIQEKGGAGRDPFLEPPAENVGLDDELNWQEEEKESRWRKIIIVIIIILILLLLFWPVPKEQLSKIRRQAEKERRARLAGMVGLTKYNVVSGAPMPNIGPKSRKAVPVGVWFEIWNMSNEPEVLDYSMVKLKEVSGNVYPANPKLIDEWYSKKNSSSPWEQPAAPRRKVKALAIFYAFRGPKKIFILTGRDFGWGSSKTRDFKVGSFNTF